MSNSCEIENSYLYSLENNPGCIYSDDKSIRPVHNIYFKFLTKNEDEYKLISDFIAKNLDAKFKLKITIEKNEETND